MKKKYYSVVVIGAGPAGMAAAISAKENGVDDVLIVDRHRWTGGILQQCIHPGFGLVKFNLELTGPEYAYRYSQKLTDLDIEFLKDTTILKIEECEKSKYKKLLLINTESGLQILFSKVIILATGCREKSRGSLNIPGFRGAGIFTAGAAQRLINIDGLMIGKKVIILGSGDIGLIMARRLTIEGAEVKGVVEKLPYPSGIRRNIQQCVYDFDIKMYLNHTIGFIFGNRRVEGVDIIDLSENDLLSNNKKFISCDTVLVATGLIPEVELVKNLSIDIDEITGGIIVDNIMQTSLNGIFACGNLIQIYDLVDYVSNDGEIAGKAASLYVKEDLSDRQNTIMFKEGEGVKSIAPKIYKDYNLDFSKKDIYIRVNKDYKNAEFIFSEKGKTISTVKKKYANFSEITILNLKKIKDRLLNREEIEISVKGKNQTRS